MEVLPSPENPSVADTPATEPATGSRAPSWSSLWRVVENQAHNAFNDKVAQFILLAVAEVTAVSTWYPQIVSALLVLPQMFLAPAAGWISDHCSKRRILVWCSLSQVLLLGCIAASFTAHAFWTATALFFLLAVQAAIYGPAKAGIVKELVGGRFLTKAAGWMQLTMVLAFAGGQYTGGRAFAHFHDHVFGSDPWRSAALPVAMLAVLAVVPLLLSLQVEATPAHCTGRFHRGLLTAHFRQLDDLMAGRRIRLTALGVSFFWLAATMLTLMLIELAAETDPNPATRAATSSISLGFVAIGVAIGSLLTGKLSANRVELGLVPIGGAGMALACAGAFLCHPGSTSFALMVFLIGCFGAIFMIPLHASLQDLVDPVRRGRLLSAAGLLDSLGMIAGIALQFLLMKAGVGVRWQFLLLGLLCLAASVFVLRIIPQSFLRFLTVGLIRVVYRLRLVHADRVPETGSALLLSNHVSYIDGFVLSSASERPVRFAAFDFFFRSPVLGQFLRHFGVVPISSTRAKDGIVQMGNLLREGQIACVFPEGQLTRTGMMNPIRKGFELIARRGDAPVIPVYMDDLWGSIFSSERSKRLRRHPHHLPYHISILFGPPLPPAEATVERVRREFQSLAAAALEQRGEVNQGMPLAVARALCRQPWRPAVLAGRNSKDRLRRGELLAASLQLARRWSKVAGARTAVVLPTGTDAVTACVALALCGRGAVSVDPAVPCNAAQLRQLMHKEGVVTAVTTTAVHHAHPEFPWPDHVLFLDAEREESDPLRFALLLGAAWLAPAFAVHWLLPRERGDGGGGGITTEDGQPRCAVLDGRELMLQTEMLRGTDLMREGEALLNLSGFSCPEGYLAGLWAPLLRGIPLMIPAPGDGPPEACFRPDDAAPDLAVGPPAAAAGLAAGAWGPSLRVYLHTGESCPGVPEGFPGCRCFAPFSLGGFVSVSMPDPPMLTSTAEPQAGLRHGSCGRLLTGVSASDDGSGLLLELPGGRRLLLPQGSRIDDDSFLFVNSAAP
jgi:acyl-[acyl-carrier-protein]-phospholipid O-acyltransferase/long-chain-fatty-acid--[acyl-carrier-protein] ligase